MIRYVILVAITLLGMGCQSIDTHTKYYQLANAPVDNNVEQRPIQLIIEPVVLVDFLKRPNILLKQQNNTLYVTNYHVWAEPLDKAIGRAMVNFINKKSETLRAEHRLFNQCVKKQCFHLTLLIEAFYPSEQSQVQLSGKYRLRNSSSEVIHQQDFHLVNELEIDGYPHAVEQLQDLIYQLSSQIEQNVGANAVH